jgi:hypothetical protein
MFGGAVERVLVFGLDDSFVDLADLAYPGDPLWMREIQDLPQRPVKMVGDERDLFTDLGQRVGDGYPEGPSGSGTACSP